MSGAKTGLGALAVALAAMPSIATAEGVERFSADVSATAAYSNNPFSLVDIDTGSPLLTVDFSPRYSILSERSTVTVSANANLQQYLRRYGRNDSYTGAVDYELRPSQQVSAHTRLEVSSAVLGAFNSYQPTFGNGLGSNGGLSGGGTSTSPVPTLPSIVPVTDIGLFGLRSRRNLARLSGDLSVGLSSRDSLTFSAYAEAARYKANTPLGNYDAFSGSVGYSRQVTDRVRLGVRASASSFNYKVDNSKSRVFPIEVTVSGRLSEQWTIDGAAGATFIDNNSVGSTSKTSLSGNLSLCRRGQLTTLCILGARQASPTGFIGTQYVTSAGLNWSTRLNERSNLTFSADYSKVGVGSVPLAAARAFQSEFAQAVVSYDRRISQRLRLVASANYRQLLSDSTGRPKDFGGQIGISYRIGDPR